MMHFPAVWLYWVAWWVNIFWLHKERSLTYLFTSWLGPLLPNWAAQPNPVSTGTACLTLCSGEKCTGVLWKNYINRPDGGTQLSPCSQTFFSNLFKAKVFLNPCTQRGLVWWVSAPLPAAVETLSWETSASMISFCGQSHFGPGEKEKESSFTFSLSPPVSATRHSVFEPFEEGALINWLSDGSLLPGPQHSLKIGEE